MQTLTKEETNFNALSKSHKMKIDWMEEREDTDTYTSYLIRLKDEIKIDRILDKLDYFSDMLIIDVDKMSDEKTGKYGLGLLLTTDAKHVDNERMLSDELNKQVILAFEEFMDERRIKDKIINSKKFEDEVMERVDNELAAFIIDNREEYETKRHCQSMLLDSELYSEDFSQAISNYFFEDLYEHCKKYYAERPFTTEEEEGMDEYTFYVHGSNNGDNKIYDLLSYIGIYEESDMRLLNRLEERGVEVYYSDKLFTGTSPHYSYVGKNNKDYINEYGDAKTVKDNYIVLIRR